MQRPHTRQSPGPCAKSRALVKWIKERGICAACGDDGGVIAHHCAGSSAKIRVDIVPVMIGHFFINGLCLCCDEIVTQKSRREFRELYGPESQVYLNQIKDYPVEIPPEVIEGVKLWRK